MALSISPMLGWIVEDESRLWSLDGGLERHPDVAADWQARVAQVLRSRPHRELLEEARHDESFVRGDTGLRDNADSEDPITVESAAARVAQLELTAELSELRLGALSPPAPEDRVCSTVPGLFEALDRRGLLPLGRDSFDFGALGDEPAIHFGEWALRPHPFIAKSRELVVDLAHLTRLGQHQVRLAISPYVVLPWDAREEKFLRDYWFGAKLHLDTLDDTDNLGTVRYARGSGFSGSLFVMPLLRVDVTTWLQDPSTKAFEVTEVVPAGPERLVVNRYLHALRDIHSGQWKHVDGAARAYDVDTYPPSPSAPAGDLPQRAALYRKLWRVDGPIDDTLFGCLLARHFRGNELIFEAFGDVADTRSGANPEGLRKVRELLGLSSHDPDSLR